MKNYTLLLILAFSLFSARLSSQTFMVTNTGNAGPGSLRQAITDANAYSGAPTITFEIPVSSVLQFTTDLPQLNHADLTIDGTTAPGYSYPEAIVTLNWTGRDDCFEQKLNNVTIRGLAFTNDLNGSGEASIRAISGSNLLIENCRAFNQNRRFVSAQGGTGIQVKNCMVENFNNDGNAKVFEVASGGFSLISGCIITNIPRKILEINSSGAAVTTFSDNIITNVGYEDNSSSGGRGAHVIQTNDITTRLVIKYNIINGCKSKFMEISRGTTLATRMDSIYNNAVINCTGQHGIYLQGKASSYAYIADNYFDGDGGVYGMDQVIELNMAQFAKIKGNVIKNAKSRGIMAKDSDGTLIKGNVMYNLNNSSIIELNDDCDNIIIRANIIGTDSLNTPGLSLSTDDVIRFNDCDDCSIGGDFTLELGNQIIAAPEKKAIQISGSCSGINTIQGNDINVSSDGLTNLSTSTEPALEISTTNVVIGGESNIYRNRISGLGTGIKVTGQNTSIQGNLIGCTQFGSPISGSAMPVGILVEADNVTIGSKTTAGLSNLLGYCAEAIRNNNKANVLWSGNRFFNNTGPVVVNNEGGGANGGIAAPVISGGSLPNTVFGTSLANARVEVYHWNPAKPAQGYEYLGFAIADGSGTWSFTSPVALNDEVAALQIDNLNSSEFSSYSGLGILAPTANHDNSSGNVVGLNAVIDILANDFLSNGNPATASLVAVDLDLNMAGVQNTLTFAGEGIWAYNNSNGLLTFDPQPGFTTDPSIIQYQLTDNSSGYSDLAVVWAGYNEVPPVANDDSSNGNTPGVNAIVNILSNDILSDGSPATPETVNIDVNTAIHGIQTSNIIQGKGTWTYNTLTGVITFDPLPGFSFSPPVLNYNLLEICSGLSDVATVTVTYNTSPPVANNDVSGNNFFGSAAVVQILANDHLSDGSVPAPALVSVDINQATPGIQATLTVPGQGVWTYSSVNGDLTFSPESGFMANPLVITYTLIENATTLSDQATVTVTYISGPEITISPLSIVETHSTPPQITTKQVLVTNTGSTALSFNLEVLINSQLLKNTSPEEKISQEIASNPTVISNLVASGKIIGGHSPYQTDDALIRYDNGENEMGMGLSGAGNFEAAAYFPAATMAQYSGMQLTKIEFFINDAPSQCILKVYGQGTSSVPGTLLHQQSVTPTINSWNLIELTTPVAISGGDIWFGYQVIQTAAYYPAGVDPGPAIAGFGDRLKINGSWTTLSGNGLNNNWNLAGHLTGTSWLSASPLSGNLNAGESVSVEVTLNSAGLSNGIHAGTLNFTSNDPTNPVINVPVTLNVGENVLNPPQNLQAVVINTNDVDLNWDAPGGIPGELLNWDDGVNNDGIGLTSGGTFSVAARWEPQHLSPFDDWYLTRVNIFPKSNAGTTFILKVWSGANAGTLLVSQTLNGLIQDSWNEIILDNPVVINAGTELWVGYTVQNQPAGDYPAGCDDGPAIAGFGDKISLNGSSWDNLSGLGLNFNWNIQAYVQPSADGATAAVPLTIQSENFDNNNSIPVAGNLKPSASSAINKQRGFLGYNVYRNNIKINTSTVLETSYLDADLANGIYNYGVTAVYDEGESLPAGPVQVTVPSGSAPEIAIDPLLLQETHSNPPQVTEKIITVTNTGTSSLAFDLEVLTGGELSKNLLPASQVSIESFSKQSEISTLLASAKTHGGKSPYQTDDAVIRYDNGENYQGLGTNGTIEASAYFPATTMAQYVGMNLTQIEFYIVDAPTTCILKVYGQGTPSVPGPLLHQQAVTPTGNFWNLITLTTPVPITGEALWFGYQITNAASTYPAGVDPGPAVAGFGDMLKINGSWTTLSANGFDSNWNLAGYLSDGGTTPTWLSAEPQSGNLNPGQSASISVTFNSANLNNGIYNGTLRFTSNDTGNPQIDVPVILNVGGSGLYPPQNLQANVVNFNDVSLTWDSPSGMAAEYLHWDDGLNNDGIGITTGGTFTVAARWEPQHLESFDGWFLTKVNIFPRSELGTTFILKVWSGANAGTLLVSQNLSNLTQNNWNEIVLDNPVIINAGTELWVGYTCQNQPAGDYPAGADAGPAVAGFGDKITTNGTTWNNLSALGLDYNWNIQAYIQPTADDDATPAVPLAIKSDNYSTNNNSIPAAGKLEPSANSAFRNAKGLLGYNVYRDGTVINQNPIPETTFLDPALANGTYSYDVTAVYDEGESTGAGAIEVTIGCPLPVPANLLAEGSGPDEVYLTWEEPVNPGGIIRWDDGINNDGIGLTTGGSFKVAARWDANQITDYDGLYLTMADIFPRSELGTNFTLKVWSGTNASTLLVSQPLTGLLPNEWNTVILDTPVPIDATKDLWIGYELSNQPVGDYPAGTDIGPAVAGYGDKISLNGTSWDNLSALGLDYNWNIAGTIGLDASGKPLAQPIALGHQTYSGNGSTINQGHLPMAVNPVNTSGLNRDLLGYNIYRDNQQVNTSMVTLTEYSDTGVPGGYHEYFVTAIYTQCESDPSNIATITVDIDELQKEKMSLNLLPNPATTEVEFVSDSKMNRITIINSFGTEIFLGNINQKYFKLGVSSFPSGLYIVAIEFDEGKVFKKLIIR
jgi:hypothetical protein